jgi:hypothetical protein
VSVAYRITENRQELWQLSRRPITFQGGEQLSIDGFITVSSLFPGHYTIEVTAIDLLTNQTVIRPFELTVSPA